VVFSRFRGLLAGESVTVRQLIQAILAGGGERGVWAGDILVLEKNRPHHRPGCYVPAPPECNFLIAATPVAV
jgi:hypothetical protein